MNTSMWPTQAGSLGTVQLNVYFEKQLYPAVDTTYELIGGMLPDGITLSSEGVISGIPYISNLNANVLSYDYTIVVQRTVGIALPVVLVLTLSIWNGDLFIATTISPIASPMWQNKYAHQMFGGEVDIDNDVIWRVEEGYLPPNTLLHPTGLIEGSIPGKTLPFIKSQFTTIGLQSSWDEWLKEYVSTIKELDYQFTVCLSDVVGKVQHSYTVRIIYTQAPINESWFQANQSNITYVSDQWYCLILTSEYEIIRWNTDIGLDQVVNGTSSQTQLSANCNTSLVYELKPNFYSRLPQGSLLLQDGSLTGRISFRCHRDDPINLPINDVYIFTVRASTGFTYTEKTFSLKVIDRYTAPHENIWIRAFPKISERLYFLSIINDQALFPNELIYRGSDPWFGKWTENRFLLAPGLTPTDIETYTTALKTNHYNKRFLFGDIKTAVSLDSKLKVVYEVVYLEILDTLTGRDPVTGMPKAEPDTIDLRKNTSNNYLVNDKDNLILNPTVLENLRSELEYFILTPNGLENMRHRIDEYVGYYDNGLLPSWMLSIQPIPDKPGHFKSPLGNIPAVVLAYTIPGAAKTIAYRLQHQKIEFNKVRFEFDRYQLDNYLSKNYDITNEQFIPSSTTIFDDATTTFDQNSTTIVSNVDIYTIPGIHDKYLKFPKLGQFV
jgi:hypothetical protein